MSEEVTLQDIIDYANQNNVSKSELIYLLHLYNEYKKIDDDVPQLTVEDLISYVLKLNDSLKFANNTTVVTRKIDAELEILNRLSKLREESDESEKNDVGYDIGKLLTEEGIELGTLSKVLENKVNGRKRRS